MSRTEGHCVWCHTSHMTRTEGLYVGWCSCPLHFQNFFYSLVLWCQVFPEWSENFSADLPKYFWIGCQPLSSHSMIKEAVWEGAKRRSYWNDFLSRNGWVCPFFLLWQYFTLVSFLVLFELPWVSRSGAPLKYILFSFVFFRIHLF